jgi:hypothetical protein
MKKLNKILFALATFGMAVATGAVIGTGSNKAHKADAVTSGTETITLSSGVYDSTSPASITWNGTYVTIKQNKGTSSSNVSSSYIARPRVYQKQYLDFEAKTGTTLNGFVLTYATGKAGTPIVTVSNTANGATVGTTTAGGTLTTTTEAPLTHTFVATASDDVSMIMNNTGTVMYLTAISVDYTASVIPPSFSINKTELNLAIGGTSDTSITSTSANFTGTVTYSVSGGDAAIASATIDSSTGALTVTPSATATAAAEETLTLTATDGTNTLTNNVHVTIGLPYSLITDEAGLKPGRVILGSTDGTHAATKTISNNKIATTNTLAGTNTIYNNPSVDFYVLGLAPVKNQYTLATSDGNYIYGTTSGTYYNVNGKTTLDSDCYWSITVTSGVAVITGQSSTANGGTLEYYNNALAFYSGTNNLHLYSVSSTELSSIAITGTAATQPKGSAPDTTGLTVTATFADSTTADVTAWATWTPAAIAADTTALTASVTIGGVTKTANIACTVKTATLVSIAVTTQPTKTSYENGEALDLTGIVITGTYDDNSTLDVTSSATYSIANGTALTTAGTNTITVTVDAKTTTFTVTVAAAAFHSVGFTSATDGFVTTTLTSAAPAATKTYDGNRWTVSATPAGTTVGIYAPQSKSYGGITAWTTQIGSSAAAAKTITIRSGVIKGTANNENKITKVKLTVLGFSGSTGTISCKIGYAGNYTTCATTGSVTASAFTTLTFNFASGAYGHIEFDVTSIAKGFGFSSIQVFGDLDETDTGLAYQYAHDIEMENGCGSNASLSADYDTFTGNIENLGTDAQTLVNAITIDEAPNTSTTVATADLCTVGVKLTAMHARIAAGSSSIKLATENESTTSTAIVLIAFAAIIGCGAYLYIRRRKHA